MVSEKLQIGLLLPDVLGTYGDTGNAIVLRERALARDIDAEIVYCSLNDEIPSFLDVYVLGGGEDTAQSLATDHLRKFAGFRNACDSGKPVLAVSASMQILGNWYIDSFGRKVEGLEVLDIETVSRGKRFIGEIVSVPILPGISDLLTGFENHAGVTNVGKDALPLGHVLVGKGNAGDCYNVDTLTDPAFNSMKAWESYAEETNAEVVFNHFDGAFSNNVIGTYMHGPCLARNPELADWLLSKALGYPLESIEFGAVEEMRRHRFGNTLI